MKIGFLIYSLGGGGAERVVVNLANELIDSGNIVNIYLFEDSDIAYEWDNRINIINCGCCKGNRFVRFLKRLQTLTKKISKDVPDVVFAFTVGMLPYALVIKKYGCKTIGTERMNPTKHIGIYRFYMKYLSKYCDGYIFQTEGAKAIYPLKVQKKSRVILNPVYRIEKEKDKLPGIQICTAGRKDPSKDFDTIVRAFKIFNNKYPQSKLTFLGDFREDEELKALITELDLEEAVRFQGFIKNLPEELTAYTMFIFSNRHAGMPNVLLEAMAAGIPCIATDCDFGPRELIENYQNGILVGIEEVNKMAEAMEWITTHSSESRIMGKKAKRIRQLCSGKMIANEYLEYGREIIN